jgi:nitrile hydratase accessory protein
MNSRTDPRATLAEIAAQCGTSFTAPSLGEGEGVFAQPWQATAFALTVALHDQGLFSWPEWAATLSRHIASEPDDGHRYYEFWLAALEDLVERLKLGRADDLLALQQAWQEAAARTPHGQPIEGLT